MPRFRGVREEYDQAVRDENPARLVAVYADLRKMYTDLLEAGDRYEPPGTRNEPGRKVFDSYLKDADAYLEGR